MTVTRQKNPIPPDLQQSEAFPALHSLHFHHRSGQLLTSKFPTHSDLHVARQCRHNTAHYRGSANHSSPHRVPGCITPCTCSASVPLPLATLSPGKKQKSKKYKQIIMLTFLSSFSHPLALPPAHGAAQLKHPLPSCSRVLTALEFAFAFSLSVSKPLFSLPRPQDPAGQLHIHHLGFSPAVWRHWFLYIPHPFCIPGRSRLRQFNQSTYCDALHSEIHCHVFVASSCLVCNLCGAPSHPATECIIAVALLPHPLAPPARTVSGFFS